VDSQKSSSECPLDAALTSWGEVGGLYLLEAVKVVLHALDGDILAVLDALGLEHLREGALTLLGHQPVLCTHKQQLTGRTRGWEEASLTEKEGRAVGGTDSVWI
jgi:hypothetical protein